jgi:hypothetical protein
MVSSGSLSALEPLAGVSFGLADGVLPPLLVHADNASIALNASADTDHFVLLIIIRFHLSDVFVFPVTLAPSHFVEEQPCNHSDGNILF